MFLSTSLFVATPNELVFGLARKSLVTRSALVVYAVYCSGSPLRGHLSVEQQVGQQLGRVLQEHQQRVPQLHLSLV